MKNNSGTMKFEEMKLALANYDTMIRILKKQMKERTNPQATLDVIARFQQWRDDLDVQIGLERLRRRDLADTETVAARSDRRHVRERRRSKFVAKVGNKK